MNQIRMNWFFVGSYGLFTSMLLIWFWQPFDWMIMTLLMIGLTLGWLGYLYQRLKDLDQVMIKYYLTLINNVDQFKRFHQWKQGWFGLALNQLYRCLVLTGTLIYTSFASPLS